MVEDNPPQGQQSGGQQPPPPAEQPRPNVKLAHGKKPVAVDGVVNIGALKPINIPDEKTQRAGWYDPQASTLISQYPGIYLSFINGGGSQELGQPEDEETEGGNNGPETQQ